MPVRIANNAVTLIRDGERIELSPGEAISLTKEEIEQFNQINAGAFRIPKTEVINVIGGGSVTEGESTDSDEGQNDDANGADDAAKDDGKADGSKGKKVITAKGKAAGAAKEEADL